MLKIGRRSLAAGAPQAASDASPGRSCPQRTQVSRSSSNHGTGHSHLGAGLASDRPTGSGGPLGGTRATSGR